MTLTQLQKYILVRATLSQPAKSIAKELGVKEGTVTTHLHTIRKKIGVRNIAGMVVWAYRHRLIVFNGLSWSAAAMLILAALTASGADVLPFPYSSGPQSVKLVKLYSPKDVEQKTFSGMAMAIAPAPFYRTNHLAWNNYRSDLMASVVFDLWGSNDLSTLRSSRVISDIPGSATSATYVTTNQTRHFFAISVRLKP